MLEVPAQIEILLSRFNRFDLVDRNNFSYLNQRRNLSPRSRTIDNPIFLYDVLLEFFD